MAKIKFWDQYSTVTIPLLLLRSGLRFPFQPLEIGLLAILHLICQQMANNGIGIKFVKLAAYPKMPNHHSSGQNQIMRLKLDL